MLRVLLIGCHKISFGHTCLWDLHACIPRDNWWMASVKGKNREWIVGSAVEYTSLQQGPHVVAHLKVLENSKIIAPHNLTNSHVVIINHTWSPHILHITSTLNLFYGLLNE